MATDPAAIPPEADDDELKRIAARAELRRIALDALAKEAIARRALETAQNPPPATPAAGSGIPSSGFGGTADTNSAGSGGAEAQLLGAKALRELAAMFADTLCEAVPEAGRPLLLIASGTLPGFQALASFDAQHEAFRIELERTREATRGEAPAPRGGTLESTGLLPAAGLTLDAVNKLLGFFRTDFKFQSIEVASSDAMLVTALAEQLKTRGRLVHLPGLYQPTREFDDEPPRRFADPFVWLQEARTRETESRWKALADRLDAWLKLLVGADDKGMTPLHAACQQALLRRRLNDRGVLVLLQLHKLAGGGYTKKNLWSSLGRNPFFVMGGAVAGMTAFDGMSGELLAAAHLPRHGGYHSVSAIELHVNGSAFAGGNRPGWPTPL